MKFSTALACGALLASGANGFAPSPVRSHRSSSTTRTLQSSTKLHSAAAIPASGYIRNVVENEINYGPGEITRTR
jgi:hypothetical protein